MCGRIGHIVKECPHKQRKKEEKGKSAGKNKGKQENEKNSQPVASNPVPAPPASAPVVSTVERKPAKDSNPTKSTEPRPKGIIVKNHNNNDTCMRLNPSTAQKNVDFPIVLSDFRFPLEILDSFLNSISCHNILMANGFRFVPSKLIKSLFKSNPKVIVLEFSIYIDDETIVIVYDRYTQLSDEENFAYTRRMNEIRNSCVKFLTNFSFRKNKATRQLEILRFFDDVENFLKFFWIPQDIREESKVNNRKNFSSSAGASPISSNFKNQKLPKTSVDSSNRKKGSGTSRTKTKSLANSSPFKGENSLGFSVEKKNKANSSPTKKKNQANFSSGKKKSQENILPINNSNVVMEISGNASKNKRKRKRVKKIDASHKEPIVSSLTL